MISADTETHLIQPGRKAPKLVCLATADEASRCKILNRDEAVIEFVKNLTNPDVLQTFHRAPFDLAVMVEYADTNGLDLMPDVFAALDGCRVACTLERQALIDIREGTFQVAKKQPRSLAACAKKWLGLDLAKGADTWRLRYAELEDIPAGDWPKDARIYCESDVLTDMLVFQQQQLKYGGAVEAMGCAGAPGIPDEFSQVRAAWALHLVSCWGLRADPEAVEKLRREVDEVICAVSMELSGSGLLDAQGKADKAIRAAVAGDFLQQDRTPPTSEGGATSIAADVLRACKDSRLRRLADYMEAQYIRSNALPSLQAAAERPLCTEYETLSKGGRAIAHEPNVQNFANRGGVRECFVPRPGKWYLAGDYAALEMRTQAQDLYEIFGETELVKALRAGRDPHIEMASVLLSTSYEEAMARYKAGDEEVARQRKNSKPANFGLMGCMGPDGFVKYAAGSGIHLSKLEAEGCIRAWHRRWPEMAHWFKWVNDNCMRGDVGAFVHPISGRIYGKGFMPEVCNARFQGRAADGAKLALYNTCYACYAAKSSPLYGQRPVLFAHDEIIIEVDADVEVANKAAKELEDIMVGSMRVYCPDIPILVEPLLMTRWSKKAKPVFNEHKQLVPWEAKKAA